MAGCLGLIQTLQAAIPRANLPQARQEQALRVLFLGLNLADALMTQILIGRGYWEANLIWQTLPLWVKPLIALVMVCLVRSKGVLLAASAGMLLIVAWNAQYLMW